MFFLLKIFLLFISFYHILNTIFVFGVFDGNYQNVFSVFKDLVWIFLFLLLVISNLKLFFQHLKKVWALYLLFFMLIGRSVLISLLNGKTFFDMIIGFKYGIYFFFIIISSIFIGFLLQIGNKNKEIYDFYKFLFNTLFFILIFSFLWQVLKFIVPEFFMLIGYGPVGDYVNGQNPPLYYRTGKGGIPRFSGIFSGPNNYGFFLVAFFGFFVINLLKTEINKLQNKASQLGKSLFYIFSVLFSISRGAILGVGLQLIFISKKFWHKIDKKIFYTIIGIGLIGIVGLTIWKGPSSLLHLQSTQKAFEYFCNNPIGYGLGTSGPAVHFHGSILPENVYLQIMIDIGLIGFLIWIWIFVVLYFYFQKIYKKVKNKDNDLIDYLKYFFYGLFGLMAEGFFLHVFEDSMVNYLFFVPFGILIGYLLFKKNG